MTLSTEEVTVKTTCPRDCYDSCGIHVIVRTGRVPRIVGDPDHPLAQGALCGKCALAYNGAWIDPKQRLNRPLRRTGPKGSNCFEEVSWEQALSDIASRLKSIIAEHGRSSVLHTHYTGIWSLIAGNFPLRFFNKIGATEVEPDTVCNNAGHMALGMMFGASMDGFDPRTAMDTDCLVIWGANPSASAPHVHKHWLPKVKQHAKVIVIDPIRHETAESADLHLQVRPGTDSVLAFAILHVLAREHKLDDRFIEKSVQGWREVEQDINRITPEYAAEITGVPTESIEQAASWFGKGASMLWLGQALQRQTHGGNVMRSASLLIAGTGNIGKPGTGFLYINGSDNRRVDSDWLFGSDLHPDPENNHKISHMDLVDELSSSDKSRALFSWNNNIAASNPQQNALHKALKREDLFHVAIDIFATDTTAFADYVLPAASFLEFDDILLPYFSYSVSAVSRAINPIGESLPNQEIFRRLAAAMGFDDPALLETDKSLLDTLIDQMGMGISFEQLKAIGTVAWGNQPMIHYSDGVFPTASGKIDVASEVWVEAGMPRAPIPQADRLSAENRLRLLSPADMFLLNSSYGNDERIITRIGEQTVWLNKLEMTQRNLAEGQLVKLKNETGELTITARENDRVPPGVALVPKGRWPSKEKYGANVNVLNDGRKTDIGESSTVHSVEVELVHIH